MKVKIYIEGGGDGADLDQAFREAWSKFFEAAGLAGKMPRPVRGKGRQRAFDLFATAVRNRREDELPLFLVDSEDLVGQNVAGWEHLKGRDNWDRPVGATEDQLFLMICCMETWLLADRPRLRIFFGQHWRGNALPVWPALEQVPKNRILDALQQATAACGEKRYAKGELSFQLLGEIDPLVVEAACPATRRLLQRLRAL